MLGKYDWPTIRVAYISDPTASMKSIGERFGIPLDSVRKRALKEKWKRERDRFQAAILEKAREEASARLANTATDQVLGLLSGLKLARERVLEAVASGEMRDVEHLATQVTPAGPKKAKDREPSRSMMVRKRRLDHDARVVAAVINAERAVLRDVLGLKEGEGIDSPGFNPDDRFC